MSSLHFHLCISDEPIAFLLVCFLWVIAILPIYLWQVHCIFTSIFQMCSLHFFMYISRAVPWIAHACERRSWGGVDCVSSYRGTPRAGRRRSTPHLYISDAFIAFLLVYFQGSPLDRPCLREAELGRSRLCVIISGHAKSGEEEVDPSLVDKEAVLCTLNIKRMSQDGYFTGFTGKDTHTFIFIFQNIFISVACWSNFKNWLPCITSSRRRV